MVGTSKILTVSYGTFSCTLEGFDDSFNTMKAIAEYFRDLASDDRYFGAEPPTPDAEMLARIAEKEISRRVEARMDTSGITLRPAQDEVPAPQLTEAKSDTSSAAIAAAVSATAAAAAAEPAPEAPEVEANAPEAEDTPAEQTEHTVSDAPATAEVEAEQTGSADEEEGEPSETVLATADPAPAAEEDDPQPETVGEETESPEEDASGTDTFEEEAVAETEEDKPETEDEATKQDTAPEAPATPVLPAHPDADSVAAKLQRIRAVVGSAETHSSVEGGDGDDMTASFFDDSDTPDVSDIAHGFDDDAMDDIEDAEEMAEDDGAEEEATDTAAPGGIDMISRVMARHGDSAPAETAADDTDPDDAEADTPAATGAPRVMRIKRDQLDAILSDADDSHADEDQTAGPDLGVLDGAEELDSYLDEDDDDALSPEEEAEIMETVGDIDLDDADDEDEPLVASLDEGEDDEDNADEAALSEEDDADDLDIAAFLSDSGSDDAADTDEPVAEDESHAETATQAEEDDHRQTRPGRALLEAKADDGDLDRLLDETNSQMEEPEGNRRRAAIAQLKAAVAATEAARQAGDEDDDEDDGQAENAFRDDLSQVVRPRRAPRAETRTERPRPAPLKLVASQRVDVDGAAKPAQPVRPRRVSARAEGEAQQGAGSFAEFAENMGAHELPELLEAAAAYTAFVEGAEEFSRPQIMRRVRAISGEGFNREDGLRSFADLLRKGRFTKIRNGRFQIADDTRFNPERRAS